jgi:hypothetical protein
LEDRYVPSTFTVSNLLDSGSGSLRQAILDANANPGADTITFSPGLQGTITLARTSGELYVTDSVTITGPGADQLAVSGDNINRVFEFARGTTDTLGGLTIENGYAPATSGAGGGILNYGSLTVNACTIANNYVAGSDSALGGGIYNNDILTVTNSTIANNTAHGMNGGGWGGGIFNDRNTTPHGPPGHYLPSIVTITNSTIADNTTNIGGGIFNYSGYSGSPTEVTISNSTITGNTTDWYDGGIHGDILNMRNTILAGNSLRGGESDLDGTLTSSGYNLFGSTSGGSGYAATDLLNVNPLLGPLQNNGGPTETLALMAGSPARDAGDPNFTGPPYTDQRGQPRVVNGRVDIGAYEAQLAVASATTLSAAAGSATAGQAVTFTATVAPSPPGASSATPTGSVTFTVDGGSPSTIALSAGQALFTVILTQASSHSIAATYSGDTTFSSSSASSSLTVTAAAASRLTVSVPAGATAGSPFDVTATAWDPYNNVAAGYTGTVHFTSSDKTALLPADYTFSAADQGTHTFTSGVGLKKAGISTLTATDTVTSTLTAQATVTVQAAAATHFTVTASPTNPTAGTAFTVTVTTLDPYGNVAPSYLGTVHFTSSDLHATLPADYAFTAADKGKHIFSKTVTLRTAGSRTVTATDTVTATITGKGTVGVKAAAATHFSVTGFPLTTAAGVAHTFIVTALDAYGNVATGYTGTVKLTSTDPAAVLTPSPYTFVAADKGKHTFTATLNTIGTWSLTATDTANASLTGTEAGITVN